MKRTVLYAAVAAAITAAGSLFAMPAAWATASHPDPSGHVIDIGPSPTGVGNCKFANNDASFLTVDGNAVKHGMTGSP